MVPGVPLPLALPGVPTRGERPGDGTCWTRLAGAAVFVPTLGISGVVQDGGLLLTALSLALGAVGAVNRLRAGVGGGLSWRWGRFLRLAGTAGLPAPEQVVPDPAAALAAAAWSERRAGLAGRAAAASPGRYTIPPGALSPEVVERLLGAAVAPGVELLARAAEGRLHADGGAGSTAVALCAEMLALTDSEWRRLVAGVADMLQAEGRRAAQSDPRDDGLALYVVTLLSFPERSAEGEDAGYTRRVWNKTLDRPSSIGPPGQAMGCGPRISVPSVPSFRPIPLASRFAAKPIVGMLSGQPPAGFDMALCSPDESVWGHSLLLEWRARRDACALRLRSLRHLLAMKGVPGDVERVEGFIRHDDPGRIRPASHSAWMVRPVVGARAMHGTRVSPRASGRRAKRD